MQSHIIILQSTLDILSPFCQLEICSNYFGPYLYSGGAKPGNLHQSVVTMSRVTYFILQTDSWDNTKSIKCCLRSVSNWNVYNPAMSAEKCRVCQDSLFVPWKGFGRYFSLGKIRSLSLRKANSDRVVPPTRYLMVSVAVESLTCTCLLHTRRGCSVWPEGLYVLRLVYLNGHCVHNPDTRENKGGGGGYFLNSNSNIRTASNTLPHLSLSARRYNINLLKTKHACTLHMWLRMKWHCKLVHGYMVCTEHAPRRQQFHLAPAM